MSEQEKETQNEEEEQEQDGMTKIVSRDHKIHCLTIIGQIEGHVLLPPQNKSTKYEHMIPQLIAIEEDDEIDGLLLLINTLGGDVEAGLALAEMISTMRKPSVSIVLGGGHSIGVPLAVSAKYSLIAPSATMTVHPVRMNGTIIGVPQAFEYFEKMQERIIRFVAGNSHISESAFRKLMLTTGELTNDVGTVLFGEDAVECGIIDEVGGVSNAIDRLNRLIEERKANKQ